jgi:cytochrome c peroxidase
MGEVYRATDTKLHRDVALKVLAPAFAQNSEWMSRFQREVRVLASLNHPHIAAIYGLEESGGVRAIAMELVEGPTLTERMERGRIPVPEALAIARQIAEALEYAHEKGIVHRDLKPANVKLRPDGVVKVLDFGLAIMGTPAYMAPGQAAGLQLDRRVDIWAFGVVLFEMLAGRQIYTRITTLETLAAIARDEPPWDDLPPETPAAILRLVRRCLDRNAKNRLRDISEARIAIEAVLAGKTPSLEGEPSPGVARREWLAWKVAAVLAGSLAPVAFLRFREKPPVPATFSQATGIASVGPLRPTPQPSGPYHVSDNRILDAEGHPYLIRGTGLSIVTLDPIRPGDLGGLSASAFITIRQRLNMNTVRLPLLATEYERNSAYRNRVVEIVRTANRLELLVILAPDASKAAPSFWTNLAVAFRENPNVFFGVNHNGAAVALIRATGARQPIVGAAPGDFIRDSNFIYEVSPHYATTRTDQDRWKQFGSLAESVPVIVDGLDPDLGEETPECAAFPSDPAKATSAVQANLAYFDEHSISWTISAFRSGRLITDTRYFNGTKLDNGWTCGKPPGLAGLGMVLLSHLWRCDPHSLFVVNGDAGGLLIARGGRATAYGPILADRDLSAGPTLPRILGNVSVRIIDSAGVARFARLLYTGAGWSFLTFVVPDNVAPGPAEFAIVRTDGSSSSARAVIADIAPGLLSASLDGRGPAKAQVIEHLADGSTRMSDTYQCSGYACRTLPIHLSRGVSATLRLEGNGFRHARSNADFNVMIGEVSVPIISYGPEPGMPGRDWLTVNLPADLIGYGETDLFLRVNGALSNVVRIDCGESPNPVPARIRLGRYLFYDRRMSVNGTTACATCHRQELAFTDGRARARGATGQLHPRSVMSLVNVAQNRAFNWNDPTVHSLEGQAIKPMFSTDPVELGLGSKEAEFLQVLRSDTVYAPLFRLAFPNQADPYTVNNVAAALAAFERTIVSTNSAYDRFHRGDAGAISEAAKRGEILFFLDGGPSCFRCHSGSNFSDGKYHNTGLYNPYPASNIGLFEHTRRLTDAGRFRTPTLRNIALTAPYMHDGSIATLEEVIDHYASGGRAHDNPFKDRLMHGFPATPQNRADLVAFLRSLTDDDLIHNLDLTDPWGK